MSIPRFDLYLFDYDGTLCDTLCAIQHAVKRTFEEVGQDVTAGPILSSISAGTTLTQTLAKLSSAPLHDDELRRLAVRYRKIYHAESENLVTPYPDALKVLETLSLDHNIAVVSNKGEEALVLSLAAKGFSEFVPVTIGSKGTRPRKPDPALFDHHISPHFPGVSPEATLMVGDTETDLEFASNAGLHSCWTSYGYGNPEKCAQVGFSYQTDQLGALL